MAGNSELDCVTIIGDAFQENNVAILIDDSTCDRCSKTTNKTVQYGCKVCGEIYALLEDVKTHYYSEHTAEVGVVCNLDIPSPTSDSFQPLVNTESHFPDEFLYNCDEEETSPNIKDVPVVENVENEQTISITPTSDDFQPLVNTESPFPDEFLYNSDCYEETSPNIKDVPVIENIRNGNITKCGQSQQNTCNKPSIVKLPNQRVVKKVTKYGKQLVSVPKIDDWFTNYFHFRTPYYPQIGDNVHVSLSAYKNFEEQLIKSYHFLVKQELLEDIENLHEISAVVSNIEFIKRDSELFRFVIGMSLKLIERDTTINLWWCNTPTPDFIVLTKDDNCGDWLVGDEIRILSNQCWWMGTITKYIEPNTATIKTWFNCFEVSYPQCDEPELVSPWDLFRVNTTRKPNKCNGGVPLFTDELRLFLYSPDEDEWPKCGRDAECKRIAKGLKTVLTTRIGKLFKDSHGDTVHQMNLNVIVNRMEKQYYRRVKSVQFDLKLIKDSVEQWCLDENLKQKAIAVLEIIEQFIGKPNCGDISQLYNSSLSAYDIDVTSANSLQRTVNNRNKKKRQINDTQNQSETVDLSCVWRNDCLKLIDDICKEQFAIPFIEPVDLVEFPDYTKYIADPIDLKTIRNRLEIEKYSRPENMEKDLRLLISNSRHYNLQKISDLYKCTTFLEQYVSDRMPIIIRDYLDTHRRDKRPKRRD
ncbi:bromodomain and WD repeat-containing protein 3-like isoform X2 [Leptotrombidium deliense]|uniref:Bromodomain and WD repeat-containing protein 3-like isoform X2 n=1 Tax=Leptotrombidium deliense TaxID=299467 RepID=A0A443STB4_9ACAR|nr:bromodomain and WD repeat-containing protein 3-like isoform X2 [Leptotrombidium deliense]